MSKNKAKIFIYIKIGYFLEYCLQNHFFKKEFVIISELMKYAPSDSKLLSIPSSVNAADTFLTFVRNLPPSQRINNNLVGLNLLFFLQSINRTLARLYAAHQYIVENHQKKFPPDLKQSEIDYKGFKETSILEEYSYTLRQFISTLRIAVDQIILLTTMDSNKYPEQCDCIGDFLKKIEPPESEDLSYDRKFLIGLNASANYLKHHPYQLEEPAKIINLLSPSLLVIADRNNKKNKYDCLGLMGFFKNEIYCQDNNYVSCWISCDLLVQGFNTFYKKIQLESKTTTSKI